jgi:diguanylate cyclase (GGDEF)-like protein
VARLDVGRQDVARLDLDRSGVAIGTAIVGPRTDTTPPARVVPAGFRWLTGARGVRLLTLAIALAAIGVCIPLVGAGPVNGGLAVPWWVLLIGFVATEVLVVHLTFGRNSVSFSMSEIPITLSFGALAPIPAVVIRVVGSMIGLTSQRVRGVKLAFNVASAALETAAATLVYRAILGDAHPLDPRGWFAVLGAALIVDLVSGITITSAMSLVDGRFDARAAPEIAISGAVAATTNACMAVIALIVLAHDPRAGVALAVVAGIVFIAYRAWTIQARRYGHMEVLYEFTRALDEDNDAERLAPIALAQAKRLTGASHAEIVLTSSNNPTQRWVLDTDAETAVLDARHQSTGWWTDPPDDALCASVNDNDPRVRTWLDQLGHKDALIAPLRTARGSHGAILVADREDDVSTFKAADLKLLETLATHIAVELDNSALLEQLRVEAADKAYLALHDELTGLPNRRAFAAHVDAALAAADPVCVLLIDLDRFKEINDTLGHAAGDRVLAAVATRLTNALGDTGFVARFGGDEFAVLLRVDSPDGACAAARTLLSALHAPVTIDQLAVDLGASIGVAIAPLHGTEPEILVQHADVAMYVAKDRQSGVELYSFERDVNDVRRLSLVTELRRAIDTDKLHVLYQPQVDVATDTITGVEALVRWNTEQYGPIRPDEFIPLAECTGLIGPLTDHVLAIALRDCATWRANGWRGTVSVNVSARNLLDQDLPTRLIAQLERAGLPAEALRLEITETSIMRDVERNIELLHRVSDIGIDLSVDDFGTGYSSLSYLKRLPVQELKIDRSFIAAIETDDDDQAIVRATIRLGHDLGLTIVAEGVETRASLALLTAWGIDIAQGYYFGRPVDADTFARRIARPTLALVERHIS